MVKRKLGRGLESLIGGRDRPASVPQGARSASKPDEKSDDAGGGASRASPAPSPAETTEKRAPSAPAGSAERPQGAAKAPPGAPSAGRAQAPQPAPRSEPASDSSSQTDSSAFALHSIDPSLIEPNPDQPRREFSPEDMAALKTSLRRDGV